MAIKTQLMIKGREVIIRLDFLPIRSMRLPKIKVPTMAPALTKQATHDASVGVIGPVENRGLVVEVNSRNAGDTQPHEAPKEIDRRFT